MPPERVAHFRILDQLGQGGMGVVYRAEDERLGRRVALKLLKPGGDAELRARFLREARAAAAVSHPNVATIFEIADDGDDVSIAMELIEGPTLRAVLAAGPLEPARALAIATAIAGGLARAHAAGVVHRDLKPENVILAAGDHPKILDFGLARVAPGPEDTQRPGDAALADTDVHSGVGLVMGTPAYMSPEQARGEPTDARTDVFSFGVLLFELLSGRRPFEGASPAALVAAILLAPAPKPSSINPRVLPALDRIVARCLAKEPNHRYPSAAELADDLRAAVPSSRSSRWWAFATVVGLAGFAAVAIAKRHHAEAHVTVRFVRNLTNKGSLAFSPDGKMLALIDGADLRITDLARGVERVEPLAKEAGNVLWFPDDDRLLVGLFESATTENLSIFSTFARTWTPLALPPVRAAAISHHGARLAYVDGAGAMFVSDLNGAGRRLTEGAGWCVTWSPDDRRIAFATDAYQLATIPAEGGDVVPVTMNGTTNGAIWTRRGLVFDDKLSFNTSGLDLVPVDEKTGRQGKLRELVPLDGDAAGPLSSGDEIYYDRHTKLSNLFRATLGPPVDVQRVIVQGEEWSGVWVPGGIVVTDFADGYTTTVLRQVDGTTRTLYSNPPQVAFLHGTVADGVIIATAPAGAKEQQILLVPLQGPPRPLGTLGDRDDLACRPSRCVLEVNDGAVGHVRDFTQLSGEGADLVTHADTESLLALSMDGGAIALREPDDSIDVLDLATGARTHHPLPPGRRLVGADFFPDGRLLASTGERLADGRYEGALVDLSTGTDLWTEYDEGTGQVPQISPDGKQVLMRRDRHDAKLWSLSGY